MLLSVCEEVYSGITAPLSVSLGLKCCDKENNFSNSWINQLTERCALISQQIRELEASRKLSINPPVKWWIGGKRLNFLYPVGILLIAAVDPIRPCFQTNGRINSLLWIPCVLMNGRPIHSIGHKESGL